MLAIPPLARTLRRVGSAYGRASPAGLFAGMFVAPGLGWPVGVQEEDRDRPWGWVTPPRARPAAPEPPGPALVDIEDAGIPVQRVR